MSQRWAKVRVPASSANLGPGYDVLGVALKLYNEVEIFQDASARPSLQISVEGEGANDLPCDKSNAIWQAAAKVLGPTKRLKGSFRVRFVNRIPLARGLGSSAAARLGGILAGSALLDKPLSDEQILELATKLEGHPDNVAPQLNGGLCISMVSDGKVKFLKLSPPKGLSAVVCVPQFELSTKKARAVLPKTVSHSDAVFNLSRLALLLGALEKREYGVLKIAMQDRLHQPYRKRLVPGFDAVIAGAYGAGAFGAALSGAGPSMLAFAPAGKAKSVARAMERGFAKAGKKSSGMVLDFDSEGARTQRGRK